MEIVIREKHLLPMKRFRGRSRYDTMTDVKFVTENVVICANREAGKVYLVQIYPTKKIIFTTTATFNNQLKQIDLFTVKDNLIYFVSLDNTICIFKYENNTLIKQELITVPAQYFFHSITFHPIKQDIVYLGGALYRPKLVVFNIKTRTILQEISLPNIETYLVKDIKFIDENTIVVSGTGGLISDNKDCTYHSAIGVYNANTFECIDFNILENSHTDGLAIDDNKNIYIVCQSDSDENILKFKLENNKLVRIKGYKVPEFPHGFDIKYGLIVTTSLKNSSIFFFPVE